MKFSQVLQMSAFFMAFFISLAFSASVPVQKRSLVAEPLRIKEEIVSIKKHNFYSNGTYDGCVLELPNQSGVILLDAAGQEISSILDSDLIAKRGLDLGFLWKIRDLIAKFGARVLQFFKCVGLETATDCLDEFIGCAVKGTPPWACAAGGVCIGNAGAGCL